MEFGLDKRTKFLLQRGKLVHTQNVILDSTEKYKSSNREKHKSNYRLKKMIEYNTSK
jgi:hypothetical protein